VAAAGTGTGATGTGTAPVAGAPGRLAACLQDFDTHEGEFMQASEIDRAYESVKAILRSNAGAFLPKP
jgi:hypothetical protein